MSNVVLPIGPGVSSSSLYPGINIAARRPLLHAPDRYDPLVIDQGSGRFQAHDTRPSSRADLYREDCLYLKTSIPVLTMLPSVSPPIATGHMPAETATALPVLLPHTSCSSPNADLT